MALTIHENLLNIEHGKSGATVLPTYTVKADNGCYRPRIEFSHEAVPGDKAKPLVLLLTKAFRNVEVTNNETGEVMFTNYVSGDWFEPELAISTVLGIAEDMLDD